MDSIDPHAMIDPPDHAETLSSTLQRWNTAAEGTVGVSAETFKGSIDGRWSVKFTNGHGSWSVTNFVGDVVFFDTNWVFSGSCLVTAHHSTLGPNSWPSTVYGEYDKGKDQITLQYGIDSVSWNNVSSSNAINMKFSLPNKHVMVAVRQRTQFPGKYLAMLPGSYVQLED